MATPKKNKADSKKTNPEKIVEKTVEKKQEKATPTTPKEKSNTVWLLLAAFLLAGVTFFAYKGALDNDFVDWDDYAYVVENNLVRSDVDMQSFILAKKTKKQITNFTPSPPTTTTSDVFQRIVSLNYHPLTVLTMRWNNNSCPECTQGISAEPFIRWNIILHILNSILVLLIIYWMSKKNLWASIVVAAIFALHPMHVESVAWVSERKDVLYTFFFLAGLLTYSKYLQVSGFKWLVATYALFVLACLSKAMAVVFPLVMLLLYFWNDKSENNLDSLKNTLKPKAWAHTLPFFATSLAFGLIAASVQGGGDLNGMLVKGSSAVAINDFDTFSLFQRFQFACYGFLQYIFKFFLPTDLCTFYPYPSQKEYDDSSFFKIAPFIVAGILGASIWAVKYTKSIATGIGFYLVTILLVLQFVSVGAVLMADRYTYLPYIGFAFMLVLLIQEFAPQHLQKIIYPAMLVATLLMIPKTQAQIETWQDSETLWSNVINIHTIGGNVLSQNMEQPLSIRGNYYGKKSERAASDKERMDYINKAFKDFEFAAKLGSNRPDVYEGIGNTYGMQGNYQKALENYSIALEKDPNRGTVYFNRAVTYSMLRQDQNAINDYTLALKLNPEQAPLVHEYRGLAYVNLGRKEEAIADFKNALKFNPNNEAVKKYLVQLGG